MSAKGVKPATFTALCQCFRSGPNQTKLYLSQKCPISYRLLSTQKIIVPGEHAEKDSNSRPYQPYDVRYPGHITTTSFQKTLLAFGSAYACLTDPGRADMVGTFGETTGPAALRFMQKKMLADPTGRKILQERPVINTKTVDIDHLGTLPDGTFGKTYWQFLKDNNFCPDARAPVNFVDDPDLSYVMLRYRQCHDLVHVVTDMPPNMLGEVLVKWFEAAQTRLPMCFITAFIWPFLRLGPKHKEKYHNIYLQWAIRSGWRAKFLMNVYFEKHWETDIDELRRQLNVEPAPVPLRKARKKPIEK